YWDLATATEVTRSIPDTFVETALEARRRIDEAVSMHLMSDVPVGVFLSGGLDSSIVTASMARAHADRVVSFAVGFEGAEDERPWARRVARWIGTEHHEVVLSPRAVEDELGSIGRMLDEPVADTAAIPLYFLARAARRQVKVVLSGEGGDEAFAGYVT